MYKIIVFLLLLSANTVIAQSADFDAAAAAFENDNTTSALSILSQLETRVGANPRIESLRALCYSNMGDNKKAYNSVLRYFKLAGRNNNTPGNADMIALEQSTRQALEAELKQRENDLEYKRRTENETVIETQQANTERVYEKAKMASERSTKQKTDAYIENALSSGATFNKSEITILEENIDPELTNRLANDIVTSINEILVNNPGLAKHPACDYCKNKGYIGKVKESYYSYKNDAFKMTGNKEKFNVIFAHGYRGWVSTMGEMRTMKQDFPLASGGASTLKGKMTFTTEDCDENTLNGDCKVLIMKCDNQTMKFTVGGSTSSMANLKQHLLRLNQLVSD